MATLYEITSRTTDRAEVFEIDAFLRIGANHWSPRGTDLRPMTIVGTIPLIWDVVDFPASYALQIDARRAFAGLFRTGNADSFFMPRLMGRNQDQWFINEFVRATGTKEFRAAVSITDLSISQAWNPEFGRIRGKVRFVGGYTPVRLAMITYAFADVVPPKRRQSKFDWHLRGSYDVDHVTLEAIETSPFAARLTLEGGFWISKSLFLAGLPLSPKRLWRLSVPRASLRLEIDFARSGDSANATLTSTAFPTLAVHRAWRPIRICHNCCDNSREMTERFFRPGRGKQPRRWLREVVSL